jgi:hypothetical protein
MLTDLACDIPPMACVPHAHTRSKGSRRNEIDPGACGLCLGTKGLAELPAGGDVVAEDIQQR